MVSAVPETPQSSSSSSSSGVKAASRDIILSNENLLVESEVLTDLIFEDLAGQELILIARNDTVNGQNVSYQPIKNLSSLAIQYGLDSLVALQDTSDSYFRNFPIKLEDHLPIDEDIVSVDQSTGNIVIRLADMPSDYQVEIQILSSGKVLDDTIYEDN